mgnify:FL=1
MVDYNNISPEQWEKIEREDHDEQYKDSRPFSANRYKIDIPHVIWWEDYCYKKGRRPDRGHRTRKTFDVMNLENLRGKTILDIGCGNGQYSVFFALLGADVYGFDISAVGIEVANKIAKENDVADRCNFSVQNASHIDYSNEFFDIVFMHEVLHHTIKYPNVKDEILRVLKIGGIVVCADGTVGNPMLRIGRYFTMKGKESMGDVKLKHSDLDELSIGFSDHSIEQM